MDSFKAAQTVMGLAKSQIRVINTAALNASDFVLKRWGRSESSLQLAVLTRAWAMTRSWRRWAGFAWSQTVQVASGRLGRVSRDLRRRSGVLLRPLRASPECSRAGHAPTSKCGPASYPDGPQPSQASGRDAFAILEYRFVETSVWVLP
jgi:hypothetical protein